MLRSPLVLRTGGGPRRLGVQPPTHNGCTLQVVVDNYRPPQRGTALRPLLRCHPSQIPGLEFGQFSSHLTRLALTRRGHNGFTPWGLAPDMLLSLAGFPVAAPKGRGKSGAHRSFPAGLVGHPTLLSRASAAHASAMEWMGGIGDVDLVRKCYVAFSTRGISLRCRANNQADPR